MKVKNKASKSDKSQGQHVRTGSLGMGDAYAYGISALIQEEKAKKSSQKDEWLGVEKETLDPTEYVNSEKLKTK